MSLLLSFSGIPATLKTLAKQDRDARKKALQRIGNATSDALGKTLRAGKTFDGAANLKEVWRSPKGRMTKGKRSETTKKQKGNPLIDTGSMIGGMGVTSCDDKRVKIGFAGTDKHGTNNSAKALWHNEGLGHNPRRHFFGLSPAHLEAAKAIAKKAVWEDKVHGR